MSTYDVTTGHTWQPNGDDSLQIAFTLGWSYDKGEPETRGSWSGDDPGWPESMSLDSVRVDPDCCTPAFRNRNEWCERFEAELERDSKLMEQLETEALQQYFARHY